MAVYLQLNSVGQPLAELKANSYIVTPLTPTSGDAPLITGVYFGTITEQTLLWNWPPE
jgi:hypothetical protein